MNTVVNWAIVGTGGIAVRTIRDLQLTENAEVVAICSRDQTKADEFAAAHSIPQAWGDFDAMCEADGIDAVYIGIPHGLHFDYAARAIRARKHVVCEKPLTMTAAEAEELQALAAEHGVFLMEAMWMKFTPGFQCMAELIAAGEIGEPRLVQAGAGFPVPIDGPQRYWVAELGGGALYDLGVYTIALAQSVLGEAVEVDARGEIRPDGVDLVETYTLTTADSGMAQLANSITTQIPPVAWVGGTRGSITLGEPLFSPRSLRLLTGNPMDPASTREFTFEGEGAGYVPMFRAASEAILRGDLEHPDHTLSDTIAVLRTMERVKAALQARA